MFYNPSDLSILKDEFEYIDTAIIPLQKIDMNGDAKIHANNIELIQMITMQLERQFRGRLFIMPSISIVNDDLTAANNYREQLQNYGFKNIVFLCDKSYKIEGEVLHFNQIPIESMSQDMKMEMVNDEVKTVMKAIIQIWNK